MIAVATRRPRRRASPPGGSHPDPRLAPWPGFTLAAQAAVRHLVELVGLDLWLVTAVDGDRQTVVASAGAWESITPVGTEFSWTESFCLQMLQRKGPTVAPDVRSVPAYAAVAVGPYAVVRAYVGVPLEGDDGRFYGTLCGYAGEPQPEHLSAALPSVELVGRMLSTILASEQVAQARAAEAASAYALTERDPVTGLRNQRGWESALEQEDVRCQRYGATASIVVVELPRSDDAEHDAQQRHACADALQRTSRPGDVVADLGDGVLAVLLFEAGPVATRALVARLRVQLRTAGCLASYGAATRRTGERLGGTWARAVEAARVDARRRRTRAARSVPQGTATRG